MAQGQIQTIIPSHYTELAYADNDIFGTNHGNNDNGPYHAPFLTGPDPFTTQRRRATRTRTSPTAAPGSRREAMLRCQAPPPSPSPCPQPTSSHSPSSFNSRMVSFRDMGCPPTLFTTLPLKTPTLPPAPRYLVTPRPKNAPPRKSRFREEF
ncbi:hypothetical protein Sste5346_009302 [Sporothrix stenoceras]|uniref:Uncharacterized protein n=1 Tax=Sporothrix stenoceras TaxID=5173 RepID=A0ABR3YL32_9PEZI